MQMQFFALSLAAVAMAVPAPAPAPTAAPEFPVEARQIGGSGGGVVGSISGGFTGFVGPSAVGGCIGGAIGGKGTTLCATETFRTVVHTKAPEVGHGFVAERQIAGSLGGHIGSAISGTLSGEVEPTLQGCIGGVVPFEGKTICLGLPFAEPTKA